MNETIEESEMKVVDEVIGVLITIRTLSEKLFLLLC
jgi:hypothetical protein